MATGESQSPLIGAMIGRLTLKMLVLQGLKTPLPSTSTFLGVWEFFSAGKSKHFAYNHLE
jgi:hypothetical protein